ncbi:MAG: hypothetical protein Q9167_000533 [Letrouitia subvulpina]
MAESSAIAIQQKSRTGHGEWKILVLDEGSRRLIDGVIEEDDILEANVTTVPKDFTDIEQIEERRPMNTKMDAVYLLSPLPHIVDCLLADLEMRRYRRAFLVWISVLQPDLRDRLEKSALAREYIVEANTLNIDFFPRESHLITFRDPWSFPMLFHPACNQLVRQHLDDLAQKIVSICVSLEEYPTIRYYNPRNAAHEANVLCSHLARFVQLELDHFAKFHEDFPPPSSRPRAVLIITDRSMDLFAPLVHEFTYQAMVHDLLSLKEGDKTYYRTSSNNYGDTPEAKETEIGEKDNIWVKYRHLHMKDLLDELVKDFNAFKAKNPQFAETENPTTINSIKDMLAGLPKYQEGKEAYSLHLTMTQDAMNIFQAQKLADVASVEQSLATGLDEDYKKPKNMADQVVRLLDDDDVTFPNRLRLIIQYLLYRDGLLESDTQRLLEHARLPGQDRKVIHNLELLGAHVLRALREPRPSTQPRLIMKESTAPSAESGLSRFVPALKTVLEEHIRGSLDQSTFPFTKPQLDASGGFLGQDNASQASLRSAKPTWARTRPTTTGPRQRIIVFVAGGATYSESRVCYEVSELYNKDVFLATSHMLSPSLYLRQVGDLSVDRGLLHLPADRPKPKAPDHLYERNKQPVHQAPSKQAASYPQNSQTPNAGMQALKLDSHDSRKTGSSSQLTEKDGPHSTSSASTGAKLSKRDKEKDAERKKKHHFLRF